MLSWNQLDIQMNMRALLAGLTALENNGRATWEMRLLAGHLRTSEAMEDASAINPEFEHLIATVYSDVMCREIQSPSLGNAIIQPINVR